MTIRHESEWHAVSDWSSGHWCDACRLPSGWRQLVVVCRVCDPSVIEWRGWWYYCVDCHRERYEEVGFARVT